MTFLTNNIFIYDSVVITFLLQVAMISIQKSSAYGLGDSVHMTIKMANT